MEFTRQGATRIAKQFDYQFSFVAFVPATTANDPNKDKPPVSYKALAPGS
jgi:hypothetical protein